jgi:hypothetical protein
MVRTQLMLSIDVESQPCEHPREVFASERFDHQAEWVFDRCAADFGAATLRDDRPLNWRFLDHPRHRYSCLGVRDRKGLLHGHCVVRCSEWPKKSLTLAD